MKPWMILYFPLLLYLLAVNNYLSPSTYDNVVYYEGAHSLATGIGYQIDEHPIVDWPPLLSAFLAIPMLLGLTEVIASKLVVLCFVCVGIGLIYQRLERDDRPFPLATTLLFTLTPTAFLWGTRVMTEWPFLTLALGFLTALDRLRWNRALSMDISRNAFARRCVIDKVRRRGLTPSSSRAGLALSILEGVLGMRLVA